MEQLKVRKKDAIITNTIIYLILAFLFLCLQHAYRHHLSPFSLVYFRKSSELFWYVALPMIFTFWLIWKHHRLSTIAYSFCVFLVGFKVIEGVFIEFNKVIIVALFFFIVISYFLYQLLSLYLSSASINSNYGDNDLFSPLLREIPCKLEVGEALLEGHLTNWDPEGCFVKMNSPLGLSRRVMVRISFGGREFVQLGEVVAQSLDLQGVGLKFYNTPKDLKVFNWTEFYELVQELGFQPERLR